MMRLLVPAMMRLFLLALSLCLAGSPILAQSPTYDLVIRNGRIIDGTGSPWYSGDLGIVDGRIAAIGRLENAGAKQTVDARGEVVAPGFIDMLGQSELAILVDPRLPSKIFQGITTEITGEGGSPAPLNDAIVAADRAGYEQLGLTPDWRTLAEYYARLERQGLVRRPTVKAPRSVLAAPPPRPRRGARLSDAVLSERDDGR